MNSQDLQSYVELPAHAIAESFLAFPGMRLTHPPEPDWWTWTARWDSGQDYIMLDFTLFDELEGIWGGSQLKANCSSSDILTLLKHMNQRHPGIWLHDPECNMYGFEHLQ